MKKNSILILTFCFSLSLFSQKKMGDTVRFQKEISIISTRANQTYLNTFQNIKVEQLSSLNLGQDIPILLQSMPSLTFSSDAGNGIGYTNMNLRGSDAQRIQVNINGIPYNDAESHSVFWVNIPDIISSADDIQVQRGVGFSTLGGTSFGGSVSIKTTKKYSQPFLKLSTSAGSFNTLRSSILGSTGVMKNGWQATARATYATSDGYIDRAFSRLNSTYLALSNYQNKFNTHLIVFNGNEKTYQAWYGVEQSQYTNNRTFNIAGTDYEQKAGNPYENQVDDYSQTHVQWINNFEWNSNWQSGFTAYYVKGGGFYEEYKVAQNLNNYNLNLNQSSDLVRQLWLDNHLIGFNMSNNFQKGIFQNQTAFHLNNYIGSHFGELVSIIDNPNFVAPFRFYDNKSTKMDATFFSKSSLTLKNWVLNFDLQARFVNYNASGMLRDNIPVFIDQNFLFFNPKFGVNYTFNNKNKMYFFAGIGQKEPNRSDFIDAKMNENPKAEKMLNFELGHTYNTEKLQIESNLFAMLYKDQLINTGAVNDVGSPIRQNVDKSYRVGAEFTANYQIANTFSFASSMAYNISKIVDYTYFINAFNEDYTINNQYTEKITKNNVDIAFTPRWNSFLELKWTGLPRTAIAINNKTVGKQYIDNTQETSKSIPLYSFFNLTFEHKIKSKFAKEIALNLLVNNLFDNKTFTNAYTYNTGRFVSSNGDVSPATDFNYVFPQAGINVLMGMSMTF